MAFMVSADVTGHGVPSAIVTGVLTGAICSGLKSHLALESYDPQTVIEEITWVVNEVIYETGRRADRLATMSIVAIDLNSGQFWSLAAGHTPLMKVENGTPKILIRSGSRLGYSMEPKFGLITGKLNPGDALFVYTDGLVENQDAEGRTLGSKDLKRILQGGDIEKSFAELRVAYESIVTSGSTIKAIEEKRDDCAFILGQWQPGGTTLPVSEGEG